MSHKLREVIVFGEQLLNTEDLDPVYVALVRANLPKDQLYRLLLAYFCFYHLGAAARISESKGETFWEIMEIAARNGLCWPSEIWSDVKFDRWPRGSERRHFRGGVCVEAVKNIKNFCAGKTESGDLSEAPPEFVVGLWLEMGTLVTFEGFLRSVQTLPLFGPWIAFKVADVLERVCGAQIEFPNDLTLLYKEPRAALDMLDVLAVSANAQLLQYFAKFLAPPRYERSCNIQEVETICCKWKSSVGGHYHIGKDIHEIRKGLVGWGDTADRLLSMMPKEVARKGELF